MAATSNYTRIPHQEDLPRYRDTFAHFVAKQFKQQGHNFETVYSYLWTIGVPNEVIKGVILDIYDVDPGYLRQDPYMHAGRLAPMPDGYFNQSMPNRSEQDTDVRRGVLHMQPESLQELAEAFENPPEDVPRISDFSYERRGDVFKFHAEPKVVSKLKSALGGVVMGESLLIVEASGGDVVRFARRFLEDLSNSGLIGEVRESGHWETTIEDVPVDVEIDEQEGRFIITDGGIDEAREPIRSKVVSEWGFEPTKRKGSTQRYENERRRMKVDFASDIVVFYPIGTV